jgi:hypothetical protein
MLHPNTGRAPLSGSPKFGKSLAGSSGRARAFRG